MATTLEARVAPQRCAGYEVLEQRDGHRAEQAVAGAGRGRKAKTNGAADVAGFTAAALCILAGREGA